MAILIFQHHPDQTPARLGDFLRDMGHRLRVIRLHDGQPVPVDLDDVDGVVSLGGPMNVDEKDQHPWMQAEIDLLKAAHDAERPVVGVCLGMQLLAVALGGEVGPMDAPEIGFGQVQLGFPGTIDAIYAGVPWKTWQFHSHGQEVKKLPPGAAPLAGSKACKTQAFKLGFTTYGFQYHFEWSRDNLETQLGYVEQTAAAGGFGNGTDLASIRQSIDEHYELYRHLGDRLVSNITNLLFAIDKRLGHHATIEPVANFKPEES